MPPGCGLSHRPRRGWDEGLGLGVGMRLGIRYIAKAFGLEVEEWELRAEVMVACASGVGLVA